MTPTLGDRARRLRDEMTDAERRLWLRLRRKQVEGHRFRRQVVLGPYIADFVCLSARVVVEVDAWLEADGSRVLRYGNHDVLARTDDVVEDIWRHLAGG